jgi:hypothetical protein
MSKEQNEWIKNIINEEQNEQRTKGIRNERMREWENERMIKSKEQRIKCKRVFFKYNDVITKQNIIITSQDVCSFRNNVIITSKKSENKGWTSTWGFLSVLLQTTHKTFMKERTYHKETIFPIW